MSIVQVQYTSQALHVLACSCKFQMTSYTIAKSSTSALSSDRVDKMLFIKSNINMMNQNVSEAEV
jgi:hypothetical protein